MGPNVDTTAAVGSGRKWKPGYLFTVASFVLLVVAALVVGILIYVGNSAGVAPPADPLAEYHLSPNVVPLWYNLSARVYLPGYLPPLLEQPASGGYGKDHPATREQQQQPPYLSATVTIKVRVLERDTREIELNALHLNITSDLTAILVSVDANDEGQKISVSSVEYREEFGKVIFHLSSELRAVDTYRITIPYSALLKRCWIGLCYNYYYDQATGLRRYFAVSHFEPVGARRFVPCFDETPYKAVWKVSVTHPVGTTATSNAIEVNTRREEGGWIRTQFTETPPMSSYLVAIAVSDFVYRETMITSLDGKTIRFRVWSRPVLLSHTESALTAGAKILRYFEDRFQIAFPMRKMDFVAVPDFLGYAMENWGMNTYDERDLVREDPNDPVTPWSTDVIAHELAHQWFGDLVTIRSPSDLFLNEGFANYMADFGAAHARNMSISVADSPWISTLNMGRYREMLSIGRPLHYKLETPGDYTLVYDYISYGKGAFVIRALLAAQMGEENLLNGLRKYLREHTYSNTDYTDLLEALSAVTTLNNNENQLSVRDFAEGWITNGGYPLVSVRRLNTSAVELTQSRFMLDSEELDADARQGNKTTTKARGSETRKKEQWWIPIWYSVDGVEKEMRFLHEALILTVDESQLLLVNPDSKGLYRVSYDEPLRNQIVDRLMQNRSSISEWACLRFIDDLFYLAEGDYISYEEVLNFVASYGMLEDRPEAANALLVYQLTRIADRFGNEPERQVAEEYINWFRQRLLLQQQQQQQQTKTEAQKSIFPAEMLFTTAITNPRRNWHRDWMMGDFGRELTIRSSLGSGSLAPTPSLPPLIQRAYGEAIYGPVDPYHFYRDYNGLNERGERITEEEGDHRLVSANRPLLNRTQLSSSTSGAQKGRGGQEEEEEDEVSIALRTFRDLFLAPCLNNSQQMSSQCSRVPQRARNRVYCDGVEHGTRATFDLVKSLYHRETGNSEERIRLLYALACVQDEALLKLILRAIIHDNDPFLDVPYTQLRLFFAVAYDNPLGRKLVTPFFMANYETILDRYRENLYLHRMIETSFQDNTHEGIHTLAHFLEAHAANTTKKLSTFASTLITLKTERKWLDKNFLLLSEWFSTSVQNNAKRR